MRVLRQPRITKFSPTDNLTPFQSGSLHPRWRDEASLLEEMAQHQLGTLTLTGRVVKFGAKNEKHVEAVCSACRQTCLLYPSNIRMGESTNCVCQRAWKHHGTRHSRLADPKAVTVSGRYDAIIQRCNNPNCRAYPDYGGRGVKC